jgi:hypothetical protein
MLGSDAGIGAWEAQEVPGGRALGPIEPLFTKLDSSALDD